MFERTAVETLLTDLGIEINHNNGECERLEHTLCRATTLCVELLAYFDERKGAVDERVARAYTEPPGEIAVEMDHPISFGVGRRAHLANSGNFKYSELRPFELLASQDRS